MADTNKIHFKEGDFLKKNHKKGSFMIYEGNDISTTTLKKITLVLLFDPEAFEKNSIGVYTQIPMMYVGDKYNPSSETIDTEVEDYWISPCTEEEIKAAMEKLEEYDLKWDKETLTLSKISTSEVIRKIVTPNNEYDGHTIIPSNKYLLEQAKNYCKTKYKTVATTYPNYDEYQYYE